MGAEGAQGVTGVSRWRRCQGNGALASLIDRRRLRGLGRLSFMYCIALVGTCALLFTVDLDVTCLDGTFH